MVLTSVTRKWWLYNTESFVVDTIDENAMNDFFDKQDDTILDFTESNPFGDIGKVG